MGQTFLLTPKLIEINTIKVHQHKAPASKRILNTFLRRVGGEKLVKNHVKNKKQEGKLKSKPSILIKKARRACYRAPAGSKVPWGLSQASTLNINSLTFLIVVVQGSVLSTFSYIQKFS